MAAQRRKRRAEHLRASKSLGYHAGQIGRRLVAGRGDRGPLAGAVGTRQARASCDPGRGWHSWTKPQRGSAEVTTVRSARARARDIRAVEAAAALGWGGHSPRRSRHRESSSPRDFAASSSTSLLLCCVEKNAMVSMTLSSMRSRLRQCFAYRLLGKRLFGTWAGSAFSRQAFKAPPTTCARSVTSNFVFKNQTTMPLKIYL